MTGATTTDTALPIRSSDAVRCAEAIVDRAGRDIAMAIPIGVGKPVALVNALYRLAEADKRLRLRIFTGLSLVRPPYRTSLERRFVEPLLDRLFGNYPDLDYTKALRGGWPAAQRRGHRVLHAGRGLALQRPHAAQLHEPQLLAGGQAPRSASAPTSSASWWRRTRKASHASASAPTPTSRSTCCPTSSARRTAGQPLALAVEINANLPYMPGAAEMDASECDVVLETGAPALRAVRAAQGAGVAPRLRHGAARGHAHQGRRHAADRHRLVLGRAGARADPAAHAQRATSGRCSASSARRLPADARARPLHDRPLRLHRDAGRRLPRPDARRHPAPPRRHRRRPRGGPACRVLRRQPGLLSRAAGDAARGARAHRHDRHLLHQHARRRCRRPSARSGPTPASSTPPWWRPCSAPCPPTSSRTAASSAAPAASTTSSPWPTRWRAPAPSSACAAPGDPTAAPPPTSSGATPTRRCRGSCATSSSPSTGSPTCAASPTATSSSPCSRWPTAASSQGCSRRPAAPASSSPRSRYPTRPSNRAERIEAALAPARRDGLLPAFPLGTEMTEVEQTLAGRLTFLKSAGYGDLVRTLFAGLARRPAVGPRAGRARAACTRLARHAARPRAARRRPRRAAERLEGSEFGPRTQAASGSSTWTGEDGAMVTPSRPPFLVR